MAKVPKRGQHITANFTKAEMHEIGEKTPKQATEQSEWDATSESAEQIEALGSGAMTECSCTSNC